MQDCDTTWRYIESLIMFTCINKKKAEWLTNIGTSPECVILHLLISKESTISIKAKHNLFSLAKIFWINLVSFSLTRLCGRVVLRVEKSYVHTVDAKYLLFWSLHKTSVEFLIDQNKLIPEFWYALSQYNSTWSLILARHEVKRIEILALF